MSDAAPAAIEVRRVFAELQKAHPDAHCELSHASPFELLVATVLSAQSTDVAVNRVTPQLFERWPGPAALAEADPEEVQQVLGSLGMFRQKTKSIMGLSALLVEAHGGEVPDSLEELVELPGVGRKTANVVLGVAFGAPEGVVVDTHVQRISQRLGWAKSSSAEKIEAELMALFPKNAWDPLSHTLIFHGRRICTARKPACAACSVSKSCPSAFDAEQVGRKPVRKRSAPEREARQGKAMSKKTTSKKTTSKKTTSKKTTSKKTTSKKTTSKKTTSSKAASKKTVPKTRATRKKKAGRS